MDKVKAGDIMSFPVVTIEPGATVRELAAVLADNNISGLPVVDEDGKLLGVVSEEDLLLLDADLHFPRYVQVFDSVIFLESVRKFEERFRKAFAAKVSDVMSRDPVIVTKEATLREVATLMSRKDVNRLPVVDETGHLLGIIARGDVLRGIAALQDPNGEDEKGAGA
ncbi:MAG: Magnesium transporter MgtE [Actinobacteria bacterium ADurb.Bin444]|nr:MAG: Magnesium transporter MgtE [Actinobacteria bacterium ADurb.Bin444]